MSHGLEVRPELFGIENALLDAAEYIYDAIEWPGVVFLMAVENAAIPFPRVAYYAGAWGGRPFLRRYGRFILISQRELDWADRWFERYGEVAVFVSRLMPVIRTFISVPAGVARMNVPRFTVLTFAGSFPWSFGLAWAGFALGENWEQISDWFRPVSIPIAIALVLLVAYFAFHRIREAVRGERAAPEGQDDP
jgi:membrane protein DedA with SNARE-associated domain